jgi:branched-chain amino acid aminotransferase
VATPAPILWLNGKIVDSSSASVPLMGHAAQRGSLVFDVGSFHPTARGVALFRAREHVVRFFASAKSVGLELAFDEAALVDGAAKVVAQSGVSEGMVRWSAFLETSVPDLLPARFTAHVAIGVLAADLPGIAKPLAIAIFEDARKAAPDVLPPTTKAAAAYLGPMIARRRAVAKGADDVVLLDREGFIAEAPVSNAFAVIAGELWTPPLTYVLPGITRASVLAIAREEKITIREEPLSLERFRSADEAFLTSTSTTIAPIASINGQPLEQAPGPITTRLSERMHAAQRGEIGTDWLTLVR